MMMKLKKKKKICNVSNTLSIVPGIHKAFSTCQQIVKTLYFEIILDAQTLKR